MTEEEKIVTEPEEETEEFSAADYIRQLDSIKANMISREEYNRVLKDNKLLADSLAKGGGQPAEKMETSPEELHDLRNKLFGKDTHYRNDMEYFTDVLKLRKGVIENGGSDPFLPYNKDYNPTEADEAKAEFIAEQIEECLEYAGGDPHVFNVELQRRCGIKNKTNRR